MTEDYPLAATYTGQSLISDIVFISKSVGFVNENVIISFGALVQQAVKLAKRFESGGDIEIPEYVPPGAWVVFVQQDWGSDDQMATIELIRQHSADM